MIYHIASAADWAHRTDTYAPQGWRDEGFIHCSTSEQVGRVANRHFPGRQDLVLLGIDPTKLEALVVWEDTAGAGEDYPHVYGVIDTAAVVSAEPFAAGSDGTFDSWRESG